MVDQLDWGKWVDEIPKPLLSHTDQARVSLKVSDRIIPDSHGPTLGDQLRAAKRIFLEARGPVSFVRLGDCDITLLGSGYLHERMPLQNLKSLQSQLTTAGLSRPGIAMRAEFVQAMRTATLLGLQQNWPPVRETTSILMSLSGLPVPAPNGVDFHLLYHLLADGTLIRYLAGKKILLVGAAAPDLAAQWADHCFQQKYKALGPFKDSKVSGVFVTRGRGSEGAWRDLDAATQYAVRTQFDVALLGCGAMAKVLAERIRKQGRTALDAGFIFDALLGHSQRKERAVIRDAPWPEEA
jgi:hypothetical protein